MTVKGIIKRYLYKNEMTGYSVFLLASQKKTIICCGTIPNLSIYTPVELSGETGLDKKYPDSFCIKKVLSFESDKAGDISYLCNLPDANITHEEAVYITNELKSSVFDTVATTVQLEDFLGNLNIDRKKGTIIFNKTKAVMQSKELFDEIISAEGTYQDAVKINDFYGENALNNRLSFTMRYGTSMNFIFWANLPEELAGYLSRMSRGAILSQATFPLEEMDRMDYPIMCASTSVYFSEDKDITVELYRYTYAIEVGSITADFEEESMKNKRINVKRIVLTNCSNECDLLHTSSYDTRSAMYGSIKTFDYEIFGGGNQGYAPGQPIFSGGSSFSLEYDGVTEEWSEKYKYILNNNINNSTAGRINVNSTNAASELTTITFDNSSGEGVIGVMDDKSLNTIVTVNDIVYGLPANYDKPLPMDGGVSAQDNTPKLVIEVNIEGETMFYPIQIAAPQPNT